MEDDHIYVTPIKLVKILEDMAQWDKSEAYFEYVGFIYAINDAVKGHSNSAGCLDVSEEVEGLCEMLDKLSGYIDDTPPIQQPQRFGNQAFRTFYDRLKNEAITLLQAVLPENRYRAIPEIMVYFVEGFGNSTRIDYGTGHELSFVMFLCCLYKIGFLKERDMLATGCKLFVKYLDVVRKLQITYRMEPAGSHGVWSLDDFQFVPFIWGSSQLIGNPRFEPSSFLKEEVIVNYSREYMFFGCIDYINQVKSGPFAEHSNQLWSISGVSSWSKINSGLIKMYKVEVLGKFPVVQHIYFGSLFTLKAAEPGASIRRPRLPSIDQIKFRTPQGSVSTMGSEASEYPSQGRLDYSFEGSKVSTAVSVSTTGSKFSSSKERREPSEAGSEDVPTEETTME